MVEFTKITFDADWVYAHAYDLDNNLECDIKIKRNEEVFEPKGFDYVDCHRGALTVRREVNNGKLKQNSNRTVAWG